MTTTIDARLERRRQTSLESVLQDVETKAQDFARKLEQHLCELPSNRARADFLIKYDLFNRGFPGGALQLAGNIALATSTFGYEEAEIVSSSILAGVVDEFMDRERDFRPTTHGSLRRSLMRVAVDYLMPGINYGAVVETCYTPYLNSVVECEIKGYRTNKTKLATKDIFRGMGFFLGSETSGASEFTVLHNYLGSSQPALVEILRKQQYDGRSLYQWVEDHTTLEADHANFARQAIITGVNTQKSRERTQALRAVQEGINDFFEFAEEVLMRTPVLLPENDFEK